MTTGPDAAIGPNTAALAVVLHPSDDVAVLIGPVRIGQAITTRGAGSGITLCSNAVLPAGHKVALRCLSTGSEVRKYGAVIGRLTADVVAGDHVHIHNLVSQRAH